MNQNQTQQTAIRLGTHGEHYGSWMSNPVFYVMGAILALSVVLAVLSLRCSISRRLAWCS